MKKHITLLAVMLTIAGAALARPVDSGTAQKVAQNFMRAVTGQSGLTLRSIGESTPFTQFYVFTSGGKDFVMVAADDCATPIVGYSLTSQFVTENMPAHVRSWFDYTEEAISAAAAKEQSARVAAKWQQWTADAPLPQKASGVATPLLSTTWNQAPYYNNLCPEDENEYEYYGHKVVVGCVATATAQIMKYWDYPTTGYGSHSYTHSTYGTLSANFGETTYDWDNMPNALDGTSSSTEVNAVATLMYHIGVADEMNYDLAANGGSGAQNYNWDGSLNASSQTSLMKYFKYKPTMYAVARDDMDGYSYDEVLRTELDQSRPILYSGRSSSGGHSFVVDGYDEYDMFHINWGWGGYQDGYFPMGGLEPGTSGIGGNSESAYNQSNVALLGIEPNYQWGDDGTVSATVIGSGSVSGTGSYSLGDEVSLTATASEGYRFAGWNGAGRFNPMTLYFNGGNISTTAQFEQLGGDTLDYMGSYASYLSSLGNGSGAYWGIRIPSSVIDHSKGLTAVEFYAYDAANYTIDILTGTSTTDFAVVSTTNYYASTYGWQHVDLDELVSIATGDNLWIRLYCDELSYPAAMTYYSGNDDGMLWGYNMNSIASSWPYTFMVRGILGGEADTAIHTVTINNPDDGYVYYRSYDADGNSFGQGRIHGTVNVVLNSGEYVCLDFGDADPQKQPNIGVGYENALVASVSFNGEEYTLDGTNFSITNQWNNYGYRLYSICHTDETDATFDVSFTALPVDTSQFNLTAINNGGGYFRFIKDEGSQTAIPNTNYFNLAEGESMSFTMASFSSVFEEMYGYKAAPDSAARLLHFYLDGVDIMDQLDELNWSDEGYTFYYYDYTATDSNMHTIEAVYGPYFEEGVCEAASHLKAYNTTNASTFISWMPASNADEGYIVWVSGDGTYFPVNAYSTSTWIDGLQPSTTYTVKVTSICNGDTLYSDPFSFTTRGNQGNINLTTNGGWLHSYYFGEELAAGTYTMTGYYGDSTQIAITSIAAAKADGWGVDLAHRLLESVTIDGEEIALDGSDPRVYWTIDEWESDGYIQYYINLPFPDGGESNVDVVFTGDSAVITLQNPDHGYMWAYCDTIGGQVSSEGMVLNVAAGTTLQVNLATYDPSQLDLGYDNEVLTALYIDGEKISLENSSLLTVNDYMSDAGYIMYNLTLPIDADHTIKAVFGPWTGGTYDLTITNEGGGYLLVDGTPFAEGTDTFNGPVNQSVQLVAFDFPSTYTLGDYAHTVTGIYLDDESLPLDGTDERVQLSSVYDDNGTVEGAVAYVVNVSYGEVSDVRVTFTDGLDTAKTYALTVINNGGGYVAFGNNLPPADTSVYYLAEGSTIILAFSTDSPESEYYDFPDATQLNHLYLDGVEIDLTTESDIFYIYDYMESDHNVTYALYVSMDADHTVEAVFGPWTGGIVDTTVVSDTNTYTVTLSNPDEGYMWNENSGRIFADGYSTTLNEEDCITIEIADINTVKQPNVNIPVEVALVDYVTINGETIDLLNDSRVEFTDLWDDYGYRLYDITLCNLTEDVELVAHYKAGEVDTAYIDTVSLTVQNVGGGYLTYMGGGSQYSITNTFYTNLAAGESITFCMASFDPDGVNGALVPTSAGMLKQVLLDGTEVPIDNAHMTFYDHMSDGGYIFYNYTYTQPDDNQHELQFIYGEYVADSLPVIPVDPNTYTLTTINDGGGYMVLNNEEMIPADTSTYTFSAGYNVTLYFSTDSPESEYYELPEATQLDHLYLDGVEIDLSASNGALTVYDYMAEENYIYYALNVSMDADHTVEAVFGPWTGGIVDTTVVDVPSYTITLTNTGNGYFEASDNIVVGTKTATADSGINAHVYFATVDPSSELGVEMTNAGFFGHKLLAIKFDGANVPIDGSDDSVTIYDYLNDTAMGYIFYDFSFTVTSDHTIEAIFGAWDGDTIITTDTSYQFSLVNSGNGGMMYMASASSDMEFVNGTTSVLVPEDETMYIEFIDIADGSDPEVQEFISEYNITSLRLNAIKVDGTAIPLEASPTLMVYNHDNSGGNCPVGVTMYIMTLSANEGHTIEGVFSNDTTIVPTYFTISVVAADSTMGTVSGSGTYQEGSTVTITATPATGYHFVSWQDGDTNSTRTIVVVGDATYVATFAEDMGIADVDISATISLYPNPATTRTTLDGLPLHATVDIYDLGGRHVETLQSNGEQLVIDLGSYTPGTYFVRITSTEGHAVRKLMVR